MDAIRQSIGGLGNLLFKQAYLIGKLLDGEIPDVYVQGPKYWAQHADAIKAAFTTPNLGKLETVSLHLRRGDYLATDFYVDLSKTNYYHDAVICFPGRHFLVFCKDGQDHEQDMADRQWAKDFMNNLGVSWEFARYENSETDDLNLMAACDGHIMANSSFSWWGAFLGGGMTVAPKQWFTDGTQRIDLLDDWIKL